MLAFELECVCCVCVRACVRARLAQGRAVFVCTGACVPSWPSIRATEMRKAARAPLAVPSSQRAAPATNVDPSIFRTGVTHSLVANQPKSLMQ